MAGSFALDVSRFVQKANGNIDLVIRKIALDVFRRVIAKSPVDTGRFKGNWQCAISAAPTGTLPIVDKSGGATMSRAEATVMRMKAGQVIYLVNNLAYARALEYGHSRQAPAGMVRVTLQEFPGVVQQAVAEVKGR